MVMQYHYRKLPQMKKIKYKDMKCSREIEYVDTKIANEKYKGCVSPQRRKVSKLGGTCNGVVTSDKKRTKFLIKSVKTRRRLKRKKKRRNNLKKIK